LAAMPRDGSILAALVVAGYAFTTGLFGPVVADAYSPGPDLPNLDDPSATDSDIARVFGSVQYFMASCIAEPPIVRIDAERYALADPNSRVAAEEVMRRALIYSWQTCSRPGTPEDPYLVQSASIFLPSGLEAFRADFLQRTPQSIWYRWGNYHDILRDQAKQAYSAHIMAWWDNVWTIIKMIFWIAVLGSIAIWLIRRWETFARWYYMLTPHPAAGMVNHAMSTGAPIDGEAFASIMWPVPGGRVEKKVRAAQAQDLAARAARHTERMTAEAERIKAKAVQEAEFIRAQDELATAAIAHEAAKARLTALQTRRKQS
jgi:hypothetical protein